MKSSHTSPKFSGSLGPLRPLSASPFFPEANTMTSVAPWAPSLKGQLSAAQDAQGAAVISADKLNQLIRLIKLLRSHAFLLPLRIQQQPQTAPDSLGSSSRRASDNLG